MSAPIVTTQKEETENTSNTSTSTSDVKDEPHSNWRVNILRILIFWAIWSVFNGFYGIYGSNKTTSTVATSKSTSTSTSTSATSYNLFGDGGALLELRLYLSSSYTFNEKESSLLWHVNDIIHKSWNDGPHNDGSRCMDDIVTLNDDIRLRNGTMYAHVFLYRHGVGYLSTHRNYSPYSVVYKRHLLTVFKPRRKKSKAVNLFSGNGDDNIDTTLSNEAVPVEPLNDTALIGHWQPNITLSLVVEPHATDRDMLHPTIRNKFKVNKKTGGYWPVLYFNEFWHFQDDYMEINSTVTALPLHLRFAPISINMFLIQSELDASFNIHSSYGSMDLRDVDDMKRMLIDTNPYLLGVTFIATLLHSVFDILAFKNDISFWKNRKSIEGLSVRSIVTSVFLKSIILLYLFDNDTSYLILVSSSIGLIINIWKVKKAIIINVDGSHLILGIIPRIRFSNRASYAKSKTKEYDDIAFKYLSKFLFPLILCYSIYSLIYHTHKGWYSWLLGSAVGAIYIFGFIMMTPQLFINYKLKSVAHMPWRQLTYKAMNTFIDDLFSFVIKMPTMHRLACFRDDIVFFIFLYQRWKYPVDVNRRNEYQGGDADVNDKEQALNSTSSSNTVTNTTSSSSKHKSD